MSKWPNATDVNLRGSAAVAAEDTDDDVALGRLDPEGCPACGEELVVTGHLVVCSSSACGYRTTTAVQRIS